MHGHPPTAPYLSSALRVAHPLDSKRDIPLASHTLVCYYHAWDLHTLASDVRPLPSGANKMKKRILKNIQKAHAESEFNVILVPRQRKPYVRQIRRDENGNHIAADGHIILRNVKTDSGKTMSDREQFRLSEFSPHGRMLRDRQSGSEIGLDKKFEEDLNNV